MKDKQSVPSMPKPITTIPRLRQDQREIAHHPARFKVVACGRRWGKTTLGLRMCALLAQRGRQVWWVAPTYSHSFQPWRILKRALFDKWVYKLESERFIELPGGGTLTVKSAEEPDSLRGVGLDFLVIDEAAFVVEEAWTAALRPALSDRGGKALLISTPRGRNYFWRLYQHGQDEQVKEWQSWRFPTSANHLIPPEEIEDAKSMLPERIFNQEYLAEFLPGGGEVFRNVRGAAIAPTDAEPIKKHYYVMGVDFGRYQDFTACAVIDMTAGQMVALDRFSGINWSVQRMRIAALARRWDARQILAEANAMGEPNIEALRAEGLPVMGFVTTAKTKPPLIESLVKALEEVELQILPDPVLIGELEAYTYQNNQYGNTTYGAPPGLHDDTVIAVALAWRLASYPRLTLAIAG